LLERTASDPNGAWLALVEMPATGPPARERMQLAAAAFEQLVAAAFATAPQGARLPPLAVRAVVGGARHVIAERLRAGRARELRGLSGELLDWAVGYATPLAGRLGALQAPGRGRAPALSPNGFTGPAAPTLLLAEDGRARALEALTLLVLERGDAAFSDADIARRAGMSTEAFHRQFAARDACYMALLDDFAAEGAAAAAAAAADASCWPEFVLQALDGFVGHALDHLELVRVAFVHVFAAGAALTRRLERSVEGLVELVTADAPSPRYGAGILAPALAGAMWTVFASCATGERLARLARIVHQLAFVVLAPHIGARAAIEALQAARLPAGAR
jgi:AcrR family transcriptional regulator